MENNSIKKNPNKSIKNISMTTATTWNVIQSERPSKVKTANRWVESKSNEKAHHYSLRQFVHILQQRNLRNLT
jgi:hypothetical protein